METSAPFAFSALLGLLAYPTLSGVFILFFRRNKKTVTQPVAVEEPTSEKVHDKPTRIFIPDVLARWPWPRQINPNYIVVKQEASTWMKSLQAFSPTAQDAFDRCDFNLLAALAYPTASKEHPRAGCDLMCLFFMFNEHSDRSVPSEVRAQKEAMFDAFLNPHIPRPENEWIGGELARQFWERTTKNAPPGWQKRFIEKMDEFFEAVVQESTDKRDQRTLEVESYLDARRRTSGVKPSFSIFELGLDIPDEVMSHPAIQEMVSAAVDLVAFSNDILSYNLEQLRGDDLHNLITCVMNEHHTDVNGAVLWVEHFLLEASERFQAALAGLPKWEEPLNSQVREYYSGLGRWVRGNDEWSFESERYFGNKGPEIKKNRWMLLMPKRSAGVMKMGPVHTDSSLL